MPRCGCDGIGDCRMTGVLAGDSVLKSGVERIPAGSGRTDGRGEFLAAGEAEERHEKKVKS